MSRLYLIIFILLIIIQTTSGQSTHILSEDSLNTSFSPFESFITLFPPFFFQNIIELKSYLRGGGFSTYKKQKGDLAATDEIFRRAIVLTKGNTGIALFICTLATFDHFTIDIRVPVLQLKIPLTDETTKEFKKRLNNLPSRIYNDSPSGYGDRDKLQHFFGSAFLTYVFDSKTAADGYSEFVEVFEDNYIYSVGYDKRDIIANRDGQKFGSSLLLDQNTKPSDILNNQK
jgi:hypothetical protein